MTSRTMLDLLRECPECQAAILIPDNGVWLDAKPSPDGEWGVMQMGSLQMACSVDPGDGGSHHTLHEHQPAEAT